MEKLQLITKNTEGALEVVPEVEDLIDEIEDLKNDAKQAEDDLKGAILDAMIENDLQKAKVGKYTLSQVKPSPTITFDDKSFKKDNPNLIEDFTESSVTESFDLESLKKEFPDVYAKFVVKTTHTSINLKLLEKRLPNIYSKYATEVKSDKEPTLKIIKAK